MNCGFSKETLALHIEGDLPLATASKVARHIAACHECRRFVDELQSMESMLKTFRRETATPSECAGMRRSVMAQINDAPKSFSWALYLERAFVLGLRGRGLVAAVAVLLAIVSVSLVAQMRQVTGGTPQTAAVFRDSNVLMRPEGFQRWTLVSNPGDLLPHSAHASRTRITNVYMSPDAYQGYLNTGRFPEGTVMVLESQPAADSVSTRTLLASVKDSSRFDGGWGFYDFSGPRGNTSPLAEPLQASNGCRSCHEQGGGTDHVFTQFYPALSSTLPYSPPRRTANVQTIPEYT